MFARQKQEGFSLFLVLILMLVIAFLVIITNQSSTTEMRISTNEADRKLALSRAENGLTDAETRLQTLLENNTNTVFSDDCTGGYCAPVKGSFDSSKVKSPFSFGTANSEIDAWKRCHTNGKQTELCHSGHTMLDNSAKSIATADNTGRYIIEYLGEVENTKEIFRITAKAKGDNEDTNVVLQSYVEITR